MIKLTLFDYLRWLYKHWFLTFAYLVLAAGSAFIYVKELPKFYQATVLFRFDPMIYQQGLLRRIDDMVLNTDDAAKSEAITRRPEVRPAFIASSDAFKQRIAKMLVDNYSPSVKNHFKTENELLFFVRQNLHYYRFEFEELHYLHWQFYDRALVKEQLTKIVEQLNQLLIHELSSGLDTQIQRLEALNRKELDPSFHKLISIQLAIANARSELLNSENFMLLALKGDFETNPGPVLPKRIPVMIIVMLFWLIAGITLLNIHLLRKQKG